MFGGAYPAAVLYVTPAYIQNNGATVQALANALVRGLRWIATHSAEEIAALMPAEYALGDKDNYVRSIKNSMPMFSPGRPVRRAKGRRSRSRCCATSTPTCSGRRSISRRPTPTAFVDKVPAR